MQRGAKRKATAAVSSPDSRSTKRQKAATMPTSPQDSPFVPDTDETPESTTEAGLRYLSQLKQAKDKNGRQIATAFLSLPDKKQLPEYYEEIAMPIAIDTIEGKLNKMQYRNLTGLESDMKRMVSNAKSFNETNSEIFLDAERIRKNSSNWMVKYNPAYKVDGYVAFATPLPENNRDSPVADEEEETEQSILATKGKRKSSRADIQETPKGGEVQNVQQTGKIADVSDNTTSVNAVVDPDEEGFVPSFIGKTFQQAQEQIVNEMLKHPDEDGYPMFEIFVQLPPRKLKEYYEIIKQPTSIKGVQKRVSGIHGRNETTGVSDFKSWDAFEGEVKKIWENAREYNMDGSEVYNLASDLEQFFKSRLKEAKKVIEEPPQPTLKLKLAPTAPPIKIRLGPNKDSPIPAQAPVQTTTQQQSERSPSATGVNVDQSALERQKKDVQAGVHGRTPSRSQSAAPQKLDSRPTSKTDDQTSAINQTVDKSAQADPDAMDDVVHSRRPSSTVSLSRDGEKSQSDQSGQARQQIGPSSDLGHNNPQPPIQQPPYNPANDWDSAVRKEGTDASDALILNTRIRTHPELPLNGDLPWQRNIRAHDKLSQQSIVTTLPASHYVLRLEPSLSSKLATPPMGGGRPYKLFATVNGQRISPIPTHNSRRLLYDARLVPGVNKVEFECVTVAPGKGMGKGGSDLEMEKVTIFVHLLAWNDEFL